VFTCNNAEEAAFLFQVGMKNKTMASHRLNNASSRSHTIFEIRLEYYENSSPEDVIVSKLELVDLAGSERASVVREDGRVTKETIDINKSLFTLRQVINIISEFQNKQKEPTHVPYRDSKLTSLLK
jgi:kinesin family protein 4/21/27